MPPPDAPPSIISSFGMALPAITSTVAIGERGFGHVGILVGGGVGGLANHGVVVVLGHDPHVHALRGVRSGSVSRFT